MMIPSPPSLSEKDDIENPPADQRKTYLCSTPESQFSRYELADSNGSVHMSDQDSAERQLSPHVSRDCGAALSRPTTGVSLATTTTNNPAYEIDFSEDDSSNPRNWEMWYKCFVIFAISFPTTIVVLYSTSYASGIPGMKSDFDITSESYAVSGMTTYLLGLAVGSVILAPLSEMFGRRPIYLWAMSIFMLMVLPCALAPNLEVILVFRFFGAVAGAATISNAPGTVSDIIDDEHRALAFSIWSIGPMNGPVIGPLIGGFVFQYLGWRWTNWVVLICAGVSIVLVALIKETYAPAILRKWSRSRRKETGDQRWWSRYDDKQALWPLLKINLSRPFVMTVTEPICIFWDLYIAVVYAILYLCFVAYPIVFSEIRGWAPGVTGLAYLGIGIGSLLIMVCEPLIRRLINSHKHDPNTGKPAPEAMVSIVCVAAVLIPTGELWFAWTCVPASVHWIWPILAGIPFGAGNSTVFIYASNYLVDSYGIYAASALAGNSVLRSTLGGVLPLAGPHLYRALGPNWAGTMLGLLEVALMPIPFVFYKWGHKIRMKSGLITKMQADKARLEGKKARQIAKYGNVRAGADDLESPVGLEVSEKEKSEPRI